MGVPAFFRWLTRKYPSVVVDAVEEKPREVDGTKIPVRTTEPNPNFQEFDNLYLDMNGIIHPCTHPEDRPAPQTEDEMFALIFEYIDRLFAIVRPRRLLYMAVDGVAPRAKMNQQRSRRFRASKEAAEKEEQIAEVRRLLEREGYPLPPKREEKHFDSNCITPGTPFMSRLADALQQYVHQKLSSDPGWANILVILSDANVPGEGEHKIMDFIRRQRASPSHDPNTVHCLCGADADLIMLGLATHEPNFNIIREEFIPNQQRPCDICGQYGHDLNDCRGAVLRLARDEIGEYQANPLQKVTNFIFLRLPVLREYLERELQIPNSPIPFDLERSIDDWVFMCFFVGNDFLPHLPSLEIRENAIDRLIKLYKEMVYTVKGHLTDSGNVHVKRVQMILDKLGEMEDEIFKSRQEQELLYRRRMKEKKHRERAMTAPAYIPSSGSIIAPHNVPVHFSGANARSMARDARLEAHSYTNLAENHSTDSRKRKATDDLSSDEEEPYDEVKLWEDGWKERYYACKFNVDATDFAFRRKVASAYIEGLCWVLQYYYQGCASWEWYFPFHYAPFASDFNSISEFEPNFNASSEPLKPLQQLMGVFPAASRSHLPEPWQELMTSPDSPIIDFYPSDFLVDLNGKKYAWQGVALLPFVDQKRLIEVLTPMEDKLDASEKERNARGQDRVFVGSRHAFYKFLEQIYEDGRDCNSMVSIDPTLTMGIAGSVAPDSKAVMSEQRYSNQLMQGIRSSINFESGHVFHNGRLHGAVDVPRTLKDVNMDPREPYRPQIGFSRDVPRGGMSSAGRRMIEHSMSRAPRPLMNLSYRSVAGHSEHGQRPAEWYPAPYGVTPEPPSLIYAEVQRSRSENWRRESLDGYQMRGSAANTWEKMSPVDIRRRRPPVNTRDRLTMDDFVVRRPQDAVRPLCDFRVGPARSLRESDQHQVGYRTQQQTFEVRRPPHRYWPYPESQRFERSRGTTDRPAWPFSRERW